MTAQLILFASCLGLAACTPTLQLDSSAPFDPVAAPLNAEQADYFWWQLSFRLDWPEGEDVDFSKHLLLAERILMPVIVEHQERLPLWRFHRRAGRDSTGHQFSLILFSNAETAAQIDESVTKNPLTLWLIDREMIEKTAFYQRTPTELGTLELTSDPSWPIEIQRSWPYLMMGASQSWLMLVQELSAKNAPVGEVDYEALLRHYRDVDARLNAQWRENGQHAYLHHLSAIYGYQPIMIRSSELKTF